MGMCAYLANSDGEPLPPSKPREATWYPVKLAPTGEVLLCIGNGTEKKVVIGTYMSQTEREKQSYLVKGELWRAIAWQPLPSTEGLE